MEMIVVKPLYHRGKEHIAIEAPDKGNITLVIRKLPGAKWSQTHRVWYVPWGQESYQALIAALKPLAVIDSRVLKAYVVKRYEVRKSLAPPPGRTDEPAVESPAFQRKLPAETAAWRLSKENLEALNRYVEEMKLRGLSGNTIRSYRDGFIQLLKTIKQKPVYDLKPDDVRRYLVYAREKEGISANTAHSRLNAIKFYFEKVLKQETFFADIPGTKRPRLLPNVNNEDELTRLFRAPESLKHKAVLFTAYSAGLRVSEVIRLQWKHLDRVRGQILIQGAKGEKDRYVIFSPLLMDILASYYRKAAVKPVKYVFEGQIPGQPYSESSAQAIFRKAKKNAGIRKDVTFHSLRHTFATQLLERGVDVRYIKELLGHFSIKTTMRYLHVAREKLVVIESPLDNLLKQGKIDWDR